MYKQIVLLVSVLSVVYGKPAGPPAHGDPYHEPSYDTPAAYKFDYGVKDDYAKVDFGHNEGREGYNTYGVYYVLLPDTRLQRVEYTVDGDHGYVAHVTYEGDAYYPEYKPSPAYHPEPSYQPAPKYA